MGRSPKPLGRNQLRQAWSHAGSFVDPNKQPIVADAALTVAMRGGLYSIFYRSMLLQPYAVLRLALCTALALPIRFATGARLEPTAPRRGPASAPSSSARWTPAASRSKASDPGDFVVTEDGRPPRSPARVARPSSPSTLRSWWTTAPPRDRAIPSLRDGFEVSSARWRPATRSPSSRLADRPTILVGLHLDSKRCSKRRSGRLFAMGSSGMTLLDAIVEIRGPAAA